MTVRKFKKLQAGDRVWMEESGISDYATGHVNYVNHATDSNAFEIEIYWDGPPDEETSTDWFDYGMIGKILHAERRKTR